MGITRLRAMWTLGFTGAVASCGGMVIFENDDFAGEGGGSASDQLARRLDRACLERCTTPACAEVPATTVDDCAVRCADFPQLCLDEVLAYNECLIETLCSDSDKCPKLIVEIDVCSGG